jgi:hypothetical protein
MSGEAARVVYKNLPYVVIREADGALVQAHGPFTPGTEPNLAECDDRNRVRSEDLLVELDQLLPVSPSIPPSRGTLADG